MALGADHHPGTAGPPFSSQPLLPQVLLALCFHRSPPLLPLLLPCEIYSYLTLLLPSPTPAFLTASLLGPNHAFPFCSAWLPRISHPHILPLSSVGLGEVSLSPPTRGLQSLAKDYWPVLRSPLHIVATHWVEHSGLECLCPCLATWLGMREVQGTFWF